MKEGRANLMGLRRALSGTAGHSHDNMSRMLIFDSAATNLLRICSVCVAVQLLHRRRRVVGPSALGIVSQPFGHRVLTEHWFWSCVS